MYFSAIIAVLGVIYTVTATRKTGQEANAVTFSKTLMERIESLEGDIDELKKGQKESASTITAFTVFTEQLFRWSRGSGGEPAPTVSTKRRERLEHLIHDPTPGDT